jgi:hypothetical protein
MAASTDVSGRTLMSAAGLASKSVMISATLV